MLLRRSLTGATAAALLLGVGSPPSQAARSYQNCAALNRDYRHGVGRKGAQDHTTGAPPVTTFKVSNSLYAANRSRDRDGDGVACEKQ